MNYVWLIVIWGFGLLFFSSAVVLLLADPKRSIPLFAVTLLLFALVKDFVYPKTDNRSPSKFRGLAITALMAAFGIVGCESREREAYEIKPQKVRVKVQKVVEVKDENVDYFNKNSSKILSEVTAAIEASQYQKAIALSVKYLAAENPELSDLHQSAKTALADFQTAEKTKSILAELKAIPVIQYEKNRNLYKQLVELHPDDKRFRSKLNFYTTKTALAPEHRKKINQFGTIQTEKSKLLKRIHCSRQMNTAPGDGKASIWGCYDNGDKVKLCINGKSQTKEDVRNVKLSTIVYHGSRMDIIAKNWARVLAETYGGDQAPAIKSAFQVGKNKKFSGRFSIEVKFHNGPKANEYIMIITEPQSLNIS